MKRPRPRRGRRRGVVLAETAIVLPLFFILVLGCVEFSRFGQVEQMLASSAEQGCRVATIGGKTQADVAATVRDILASGGIGESSYTLTTSPADVTTAHRGDRITVTISVPYSKASTMNPLTYLGSATVTGSASMSSERL